MAVTSSATDRVSAEAWPLEWPTWAALLATYLGFGLVTFHFHQLPWWLVLIAGGWLVCWHSQLQHECLHGHPTRSAAVNGWLVLPALWLWLPYGIYVDSHLRHHDTDHLTAPDDDPESFYLSAADWDQLGPLARRLLMLQQSLLGRMLIGPFTAVWRVYRQEAGALLSGDFRHAGHWLRHGVAIAPLMYWLLVVCDIPLLAYLALFVWPGTGLALVRSFIEHRPAEEPAARTVIVEDRGPLALLFLNNNLHVLHHQRPDLPWYALPAAYRRERERILADNGGFLFSGYGEIFRRYLLRAKDVPVHP
ncbi:MAG: fatty acid desaturase, partial [Alphaproteobacteria bacterium]|nr:fatty acid desaturase [Alphaproteobacteria bacterium]